MCVSLSDIHVCLSLYQVKVSHLKCVLSLSLSQCSLLSVSVSVSVSVMHSLSHTHKIFACHCVTGKRARSPVVPNVLPETPVCKKRRAQLAVEMTVDKLLPHIVTPSKEVLDHFQAMYPCFRWDNPRHKHSRCQSLSRAVHLCIVCCLVLLSIGPCAADANCVVCVL